jgi:hypothetical protein
MENSSEFFDFDDEVNDISQADISVYDTSSISSDANVSFNSINSESPVSFTDSTANKRQFNSKIWEFFERVDWNKQKTKTAKCTVKGCRHAPFSCGIDGTTRPLWRHLESSHRIIYKNTEEYKRKKPNTDSSHQNIEDMLKNVSFIYKFAKVKFIL